MGAMPFPSSPFPLVPSLTCSLSSPESPQEHPWSSPSPLPFPRLPSAPPAGETRDSVTGLSLLRRPSSPSPRSARLQRSRGISAASSRCSFHLQRARCILLAHAWPRHRTPADNSSIAARQVRAPAPIWTGSPLLRRLAAESAPFRPVPADPAARNPPVVVFSIAMVLLFLFFRNESTSVSLVPSVDRASSGLQGPARPSCSLPSNRVKAHGEPPAPSLCSAQFRQIQPMFVSPCAANFAIYPETASFTEKPIMFMHIITQQPCIGLK
nr:uncharacterized protein LOC123497381 [Aegilops tauschii subsp. strangulata]